MRWGWLGVALACGVLSACVKPYQREWLALPVMQLAPLGDEETHVLESREGSAGATGSVGAGCGCN